MDIVDIYKNTVQSGDDDPVYTFQNKTLSRYVRLHGAYVLVRLDEKLQPDSKNSIVKTTFGLDDPVFYEEIQSEGLKYNLPIPGYPSPFEALANIILEQQLAQRVANKQRSLLSMTFGKYLHGYHTYPEPEDVLCNENAMDRMSISKMKRNAILQVARIFRGKNNAEFVKNMSTSDIEQIKGVGRWTMAWFRLKYMREFQSIPSSDLGVRKACSAVFGYGEILPAHRVEAELRARYKKNPGCFMHRIMLQHIYG